MNPAVSNPDGSYARFYWPLALTGILTLLANQFQNATLARYPDAAHELATFALAAGLFHLFDSALVFTPQMVTVFARSGPSARRCRRFVIGLGLLLTGPVALLAVPTVGRPVLSRLFHISGGTLEAVRVYLGWLSPNIVLLGLRHYYTGLIVQSRRTAWVTALNVMFLSAVATALWAGLAAGWPALRTLAAATLTASALHLAASCAVARRVWRPGEPAGEPVSLRALTSFFWPVALTSVMFSLTRPILYSFLARLPNPAPTLAAMRVGFDVAMIFHNLLNQFRHLFVTFGADHLPGIRRFMARVTLGVVAAMIVVVWTPLSGWVLGDLIGLAGDVLVRSRQVLMVLCALPLVVAWRNYFHGVAMIRRRTGPMGLGAVLRNVASYAASALLHAAGALNHVTAAAVLVLGFASEAATVVYAPRFRRPR